MLALWTLAQAWPDPGSEVNGRAPNSPQIRGPITSIRGGGQFAADCGDASASALVGAFRLSLAYLNTVSYATRVEVVQRVRSSEPGEGIRRLLTEEGNHSQNGARRAPSPVESRQPVPASRTNLEAPLSNREREVLALLAGGASGAGIAQQLVLSPETVRTHIRNAMAKLGASSRAQAVALAVQRQEIEWRDSPSGDQVARTQSPPAGSPGSARSRATLVTTGQADAVLSALLGDLTSLHEVDGGAIFLAEQDGLSLRRTALVGEGSRPKSAERIHLAQGPVGRVALERRAQLVPGAGSGAPGLDRTAMCVPMIAGSTLVGVISLTIRPSRLVGRRELLLLQALATRVADLLLSSENHAQQRLKEALESFRTSWSSSSR